MEAARSSKALYIQGELNVSAGGTIRVRPGVPEGIRFWVNDIPAPAGTREFSCFVTPGRHTVTVRVEMADRPTHAIKIEADKPGDSMAEFTVVGGK